MKVPIRFKRMTHSKVARSCGAPLRSTVRPAMPAPAQLTTTRSVPISAARPRPASTDSSDVTSPSANTAFLPNSDARAVPRSAFLSKMTTPAPAACSRRIVASPSPDAPPVTSATESFRSTMSLSPVAEPGQRSPAHPRDAAGKLRAMTETTYETPADLLGAVGDTYGPTEWIEITQERVNTFADATDDHQWIHVERRAGARRGRSGHRSPTATSRCRSAPASSPSCAR